MNTNLIRSVWLSAALVAMSPLVPAQDDKPAAEKEVPKPAVAELIEQLGDRSYQTRRAAENALRARGQEALEGLRKAAEEHDDAEVKWRAQRLAKEIEAGGRGGLQRRGTQQGGQVEPMPWPGWRRGDGNLEQMFGDMFEQLERDFGMDIPRARFFGDEFFKELQQQMEDARRGTAMGIPGRGQAFSMRMDQNGIRIEVTEKDADGKIETKVYEAPDVESFRAKYPDIAQRYLHERSPRMFGFDRRAMPPLRQLWPQDVAPLDPVPPPEGERLGVEVTVVPEEVREFLGLEPGHGLRVQEVTPDSLAQTLGVQAGDILLQIGDKAVHGTDDVREALRAIPGGGPVAVKVNRRGAEHALQGSKPEPKPSGKKLEKRDAEEAGKGQIR